jgi:CTP synthase
VAKHIFVTGGVVSSLGKGLTSASIGMLLEQRGLRVRLQKFDPYINVDPGTMSPYQHGEVYVLDDGAETDLDLGHYERFTHAPLTRDCNYTTGKIYQSVIKKERKGEYLGKTVQVIPHVTDEIKDAIKKLVADDVDVVITEIGGTVGDIEGLPFLEAIRQFALDIGKANVLYIHLTLIPYLKAAGEMKTKPTQHSVERLRQIGIQPDILICRTEREISNDDIAKIALFCNVEPKAVIEEKDKEFSIYEVPVSLVDHNLDQLIVDRLQLKAKPLDISKWRDMLVQMKNPAHEVTVGVVGKYIRHNDAYKSIYESLDHAGIAENTRVVTRKIEAEEIEREGAERVLSGLDGVLVPGGFDYRGSSGKIDANSTEFDRNTPYPVVAMLDEQFSVTDKGGTMRLGKYPCLLTPGSLAHQAYNSLEIEERHRHRYEVNNQYRSQYEANGLVVTGISPNGKLVEVVELQGHPWFLAVQCHPEFKSKPTQAHPLFQSFIHACVVRREGKKKAEGQRPYVTPAEAVASV